MQIEWEIEDFDVKTYSEICGKIRKLSSTTASTLTTTINETPKTLSTPSATTKLVPKIVARPLSEDGELDAAISYLRSADPLLIPLIDQHQLPTFDVFQPPFLALTKSILYQQLAYKAGTSIYTRFIALCGGESNVLPDVVLSLTPPQLRQIGVSARKASYLHDLARKYNNGILSDNSIIEMDDKSLFTMLTMVNGIGSWSVHMFMIFSLHRPDVLPIHDTGVRKGVQMLYGLEELPRPSQMEHLCEKWRPYSSVAAWYMWRSVEAKAGPNLNGVNQVARLQQEQQQFLDPINAVLNLGACAWGQ
ncbi:DNA glycosylase superfamily protein [Forsythia ovata]|uniref:DNA glycosylase superfamily protein n=1 Tax=Forsythia ovata TaxID=205694 RepID=A0ABD1P2I4_9LAMI